MISWVVLVDPGIQRSRSSERLKAICSYRTSDKALAFDPEALTVPSGAREPHTAPSSIPKIRAVVCARSISVLQWLLNAETSHPTSSPPHRLTRFFTTLHSALRNPSRAVLQFYPTSDDQVQLITSIAQRAGFGGGIVVDYPNSKKARKVFLCLFVGDGGGGGAQMPRGLQEGEEAVDAAEGEDGKGRAKFEGRRQRESRRERNGKQKVVKGGKDWILRKKDVRGARQFRRIFLFIDLSLQIPAVPETRKGRRAPRLKIHWSQKKSSILECCPFRLVLYFTLLARNRYPLLLSCSEKLSR